MPELPPGLWFLAAVWLGWCTMSVLAPVLVGRFYTRLRHPRRRWFGPKIWEAVVIVPFKGLEPAITHHLEGLLSQSYPLYRVLLVVESEADPAYDTLCAFAQAHPDRVSVLLSGSTGPRQGQKVHNHLAAIAHLEAAGGSERYWVFADSDAVPGPDWLSEMIGPLNQPKTGVSTGYRWLIPARGPDGRTGFWSHLGSILNASAAGFAGRDEWNHAWGGSMAITVANAQQMGLKDWLAGSLSDDYQMTRMIRASDKRIYFSMQCLVASPTSFTWSSLSEFAYRQYLITRVYAPKLFYGGLLLLGFYQLGFWSAVVAVVVALMTTTEWWEAFGFWIPVSVLAFGAGADHVRATIRWLLVRRAFGQDVSRQMRVTHLIDRFLTPVYMTINFVLICRAAFGNTITWRGITYRLRGPQDIERLPDAA